MRHQAIKSTALMLGVLLLAAGPAQAGPIAYGDVVSMATIFGSQNERASVDLRLRSLSQQQGKATVQSPATATTQDGKTVAGGTVAVGDTGGGASGSNLSLTGTEIGPRQSQTTVETIQVGEVDGTICDCGPILSPGGFPLWPLLGLAGIPLFFISGDDENLPINVFPTSTPTPTTTTAPVPEPATLLLLGSGLLAAAGGARRRRAKLLAERGV